jgi:hypothetical protein
MLWFSLLTGTNFVFTPTAYELVPGIQNVMDRQNSELRMETKCYSTSEANPYLSNLACIMMVAIGGHKALVSVSCSPRNTS